MRKFTLILAVFTTLTLASVLSLAEESSPSQNAPPLACAVTQLAAIRTDFPQPSQSRGEHGDVELKITIDKDGRALATQVAHSSGYPALDKAASDSVLRHWRFNVAHCAPTEFPTTSFVTVQFKQAAQQTVSGTVNTRRSPTSDHDARNRCDSVRDAAGDQVIACLADAPLAKGTAQPSLASRAIPPSTPAEK